jgi:hypothetical protein
LLLQLVKFFLDAFFFAAHGGPCRFALLNPSSHHATHRTVSSCSRYRIVRGRSTHAFKFESVAEQTQPSKVGDDAAELLGFEVEPG